MNSTDQIALAMLPKPPPAQSVVPMPGIQKIFNDIDMDKNGVLDSGEFRSFIMGAYGISAETADAVFKKFDNDGNQTLDLEEFTKVIVHCNDLADPFHLEESTWIATQNAQMYFCTAFAYFCCLETLCTSFVCLGYCVVSKTEALTQVNRLVQKLVVFYYLSCSIISI